MKRSSRRTSRVCIVGAGAAGLTAARSLVKKGYKNITLLEKEEFVGGKCRSFQHEGKSYDLGAGVGTSRYTHVLEIMRELGLETTPVLNKGYYNPDRSETTLIDGADKLKAAWQFLVRFPFVKLKSRKVFSPGFAGIPAELRESFHDFCVKNDIPLLENIFNIYCTAFGYGYADEVPAAYYMKYIDYAPLIQLMKTVALQKENPFFHFEDGAQEIWRELAKRFDVRFKQKIRSIKRNSTIHIKTETDSLEFDTLILACPLDGALKFLDASPQEEELFPLIRYCDYCSLAFSVENLEGKSGYIPSNFTRNKQGHVMFWSRKWPESNVIIFYANAAKGQSLADVEAIVRKDIQNLGGRPLKKFAAMKWKYFPHVGVPEMKNNYYEKLESIQGENNTFVTGELLNFPLVESVASYSTDLVERFF